MPAQKPFKTVFWNVWTESQISAKRLHQLCTKFDQIIRDHKPDAFGLNEVVSDDLKGNSALLKHLESSGYKTFFAPFSPENNGQISGSAFASLVSPESISYHELGPDKYGAIRGFPGNTVKLIHARLPHGKHSVNVVVNYLAHLVPWNWIAHATHHKAFRSIMRRPDLQSCTIIGGDFNQFKFMPRMWGAKSLYHRATGTLLHPTWKLAGKIPIIQANYDNIFWTKCGQLELQKFQVLQRDPSDHTPLLAHFAIRPGK